MTIAANHSRSWAMRMSPIMIASAWKIGATLTGREPTRAVSRPWTTSISPMLATALATGEALRSGRKTSQ